MLRWTRFNVLLPLIFIVGMLQYAPSAISALQSGSVSLWTMDAESMAESGPLRYIKDLFLLLIAVAWPIYVVHNKWQKSIKTVIHIYIAWLTFIIFWGSIAIAIGYSPAFFWIAGIRWLLLLNAGFGIFIFCRTYTQTLHTQSRTLTWLIIVAGIDLICVLAQLRVAGGLGASLGASRLSGMFNNAGVASFFAFSIALCGSCLIYARLKWRVLLSVICLFIALASGTRFMTMAVALLLVVQLVEVIYHRKMRKLRGIALLLGIPITIAVAAAGYDFLISTVDRGDILDAQLDEGGRISNFLGIINMFSSLEWGEMVFGRGLGVGTNTAFTMLANSSVSPQSYRFNWLIDNAFLTGFFQFGIVGMATFFLGVFMFLKFVGSRVAAQYKRNFYVAAIILFLFCWAGNPFEQFFLVMPLFAVLGIFYWGSISVPSRRPNA